MAENTTKIFFLTSYSKALTQSKRIYFEFNGQNLSGIYIKSNKILEKQLYDIYDVYLNEFDIDKNWFEEENEECTIKIHLVIANCSNDIDESKKYEIIIKYKKNHVNFIFGLKIGNLLNNSKFYDKKLDSRNIDFNLNFIYFYGNIMKMEKKLQTYYLEQIGEDAIKYLEKIKSEKFKIYFEILLFLFIYSKNKKSDITILLEFIQDKDISFEMIDLYEKKYINNFVKKIFSDLEKNSQSWPFNLIKQDNRKEEEVEDEEEEKEEINEGDEMNEKEDEDLEISDKEILFIAFFLGYYSHNGSDDDFKLFFMNNRIKNKTIKTLSKIYSIKKDIYISPSCKREFMKLCDAENNILGKLNMETNLLKYLEIINECFDALFILIRKVGLESYNIEYEIIKLDDDYEKINQIHKKILQKEKEKNNFFLNFKKLIEKSIDLFKNNNNLHQLIQIIEFLEDENGYNQKFNKENKYLECNLGKAISNTIHIYINNSSLINGKYLLEIIPKIEIYFNNFKEEEKFLLLESAKINNSNKDLENILKIIIENKLYQYFKSNNNYMKFYINIIKNIKGIEYLYYILQIIPRKEFINTNTIVNKLYDWLKENLKNYTSESNIDIKKDLSTFLSILIDSKSQKINEFLKKIQNSLADAQILDIYIYFLENNNLEKNNKDFIINYFLDNKNNIFKTNDSTIIPYILNKLEKKKDLMNLILNKLKNKVIKEEEFYEKEITDNIKLLHDLKENNFFENEGQKIQDEYTKKTIDIINKIKSDFEERNFSYEKASIIFDNYISSPNLLYKINLLFLSKKSDQTGPQRLFNQFNNDVVKIKRELFHLEEINKCFEEFFKNSKKKELLKIKELNLLFKQSKLKDFDKIIETPEYKDIIKFFDSSSIYNKMKESKCFKNFYKEQISISKNDLDGEKFDENLILEKAVEKFNNLKNIFENDKFENVNDNLKFLVELALDNNKEFEEEISFLKDYFKIIVNIEGINKIMSNIRLFAQVNKINPILLGIKELFNLFNEQIIIDKEVDYLKKIEKCLEELKNENIERTKIEEIISFLKNFNIYVDKEKSDEKNNKKNTKENINIISQDNIKYKDNFFEFLKLIQNNPEPIIFAKSKMKINARLLLDFLLESDAKKNLQENDVQGFIKTVEFFDKYKNEKYTYIGLIKKLNNAITLQSQEGYIGEYINRYIRNFNGIKTLYNESLNKSESSSIIISLILNNSEIKVTHKGMDIEYYANENVKNKLNIEAIEELRGKALIMKSYMKKDKTKEKLIDTNYRNVRIFVDLIQKFKTLNIYLNDLFNIGLPDPENYTIDIKIIRDKIKRVKTNENDVFDYSDIDCMMREKEFKLKDLINYLSQLKTEILEQTEKCYLKYEYIRFFYGKTFEYINRNLQSKNFKNLLPIFKTLSNKKIIDIVSDFNYNLKTKLEDSSEFNFMKEKDYFNISEEYDEENLDDEIKGKDENSNKISLEKEDEEEKEVDENEKEENIDIQKNIPNKEKYIDPIVYSFLNMINNIAEYSKQVLNKNNINSCQEIYKTNEVIHSEEKEKYRGVFISNTSSENNDKKLIIYYKELANSLPSRPTLLICNNETTKEEIISFLFRAFLCPCQTLFIINKSDSLTKDNKIFLIEKTSEFLNLYKNNMKSFIIIFHSVDDSEIKKGFNNIKDVKVFDCKFENKIYKNEYLDKLEKLKKVQVITSETCGEGKSTFIKSKIINTRKIYIYFQIGGIFTRRYLFERIKNQINLDKANREYILHIDLTYTELNELVMEFLFKFLIMKYYDYDSNIFCYDPNQLEIFIEIHNEIYNYFEKYPILKFCEKELIKLSPLIEEENNIKKVSDSKIQIVSKIFEKLYYKKIGNNNINLNSKKLCPYNKVVEKGKDQNEFISCQQFIDFYFNNYNLPGENIQIINPNYYQKKMFINLLSDQFTQFTKSMILFPDVLNENLSERYKSDSLGEQKTKEIRELIINSLISNTKLFVKGPYENLMKEQKETEIYMKSEEEQNRNAINKLVKDKLKTMITYDNIKQSIIAFDDNKSSILFKIIPSYNCKKEEYDKLSELYNTQVHGNKIEKLIKPKDKRELELLGDILDLCGADNEIKAEEYKKKIKEIFPTYVFTTDNYIKMIHILMKTRAEVPIIMMGETGCGKTSLIKMLSLIKNKGKNTRMKILNIHQGINDDEIISFLEKAMKETDEENEDWILEKKNEYLESIKEEEEMLNIMNQITQEEKKANKEKEKKEEKKEKNKNKGEEKNKEKNKEKKEDAKDVKKDVKEDKDSIEYKLKNLKKRKEKNFKEIEKEVYEEQMWIFFDELNTCNSMGLISEIFCNHTYRGKPIPNRYIFIGACNPYRILSDKNKNFELALNLKNKKKKDLVYTVNPLPYSLLNYVIDFGELTVEDTKLYINSMIKKTIDDDKLLNLAVNLVEKCHLFIREKSDTSSVSLRDIKYFNIFYRGFIRYYEYLKQLAKKQEYGISKKDQHLVDFVDMDYYTIKKRAINLSVYISYYLRLPENQLRKELCEKLDKDFDYGFLHVPIEESKYIINQININPERGIAKNTALRENIFCELFCLVNKVPLIICGKPGNSKTLSVQLLLDSMKGKSSLNEFFKNPDYKEVISYPFQGSTTCTSKGVLKTFEKARNYASKNDDMISLVFFDEMGLAEESPENPLKVLHSQLDIEDNKIAFFGLTNWTLDASKMNRGIRIFVQEPGKEDLIDTSSEIAKSIDENLYNDNKDLFSYLSQTYLEFREEKKTTGYKDFHGNRDFYNLIRNTMKYLKEENEKGEGKSLDYIRNISAIKAIERNFGGYESSVADIKKIFYRISKYNDINHRYNIVETISDNFKDPNSRYLLLISKNSTSQNLIEQIIRKENKQSVIYIGSQFKEDKSESYTEEILYKIQMQMENEIILILKGFEIIYPSLYDLFNQNFSEFNGNKYAKISFSNNQSTSLINNKFKIVVLVDEKMIQYEDKPFLNRFEKHIISFENILHPNNVRLVNNIISKIDELINYDSNDEKKLIKINLKKQLISCDKEIIENLVFNITNNEDNLSNNEITSKIFEIIAPTLTQDIIFCMNINGFIEREKELAKIVEASYNKSYASNINNYLKNISKNDLRHIIYTFSNITEPIFKYNEIKNNDLMFNKQNTTEIVLDAIESTKKLELLIELFYKGKKNLCVIKFEEEDLNKMNYVKNIIDNIEKVESLNYLKYYLFIVYMKRELKNQNQNIQKNIKMKNKDLIIKDQIPLMDNFKQITIDNLNGENEKDNIFNLISNKGKNILEILFNLDQLINNNIYDCFNEIKFQFKNREKNISINDYKQKISEGITKSKFLMEKLKELINKNCKNIFEIITDILTNSNSFHNDNVELLSILKAYYKNEILSTLTKTIYILENYQILSSYILYYKNIYEQIISSFIENIDYKSIDIKKTLKKILGLKVPYTSIVLGKMKTFIIQNISEKYTENENLLRNDLPEDLDEQKAKSKYEKQKEELENNTKNQINKIKELNEILRINDMSIIKEFFNDLYIVFLSYKYPEIPDIIIKFLDIIVQIYFLDINTLNNQNDFRTNYAEKIIEKHKNKIKDNDFDDYFIDVVKLLLFLQNYSEFIYYLIDVYLDIYKFTPKIEEEFISSFINENFEHEKSDRCYEYFAIVNIKLFKIFETMIFSIKKILYFLSEKKDDVNIITEYIIFIKSIITKLKQFNSEFSFYSKEIYTLQNLLLAMKSFEKNDKKIENNDLIQISKHLDNERNYINDNLQKELTENLEAIQTIFIKNLGENSEEYSSLFINILLNEYKMFLNDEHRLKIVEMIFSNNNLIKKSIPILDFIFNDIEPIDEEDDNNEEENNKNEENDSFMKIFTKDEDQQNKIYNFMDEEGNNTFNHILLYFFECKIEQYYFKLRNDYYYENKTKYQEKIFDTSYFLLFRSALKTYIKIQKNEINSEEFYINLLKLYCIAHIKRYITHYINLKLEGEFNSDGLKIDREFNFENNDENQLNEIKLVKIYMLKLLYQKGYNIYQNKLEEKYLGFLKGFIESYSEDKESNNENDKKNNEDCIFNLNQDYLVFNIDKQINDLQNGKQMIENFIDNFYSLLANQYISKFLIEKNELKIDEEIISIYKKIKENNLDISSNLKSFFDNLLSTEFYQKLKLKLPKDYDFSDEKLNIILFIFKFILFSINNNKNNIFSSLLNKEKAHKILNESFLPGIPLSKNTTYSNQFQDIDIHLKTKGADEGAYVCSCGTFYSVRPCGFPTQISKCVNCEEKIGGEHHKLFRREGHMRIFLDEKARKSQLDLYYADKEMPNMLLDEYKIFVENKEKENTNYVKEQKTKLINKKDFINKNLDLSRRNIDNLSFRVLNFILYSHLFYSNIIGILTDEEIKNFQIEDMTIFNILEEDYKIIKLLIKDINHIKDIKEFMNILYYTLEKDINEELFETKEKRDEYEKKINNKIDSYILNNNNDIFKKLKFNYQENLKYLNLNKKSLKKIINQDYSPDENEYINHPYFKELKFFMLSNCPSIDLLKNNLKNINDAYKKYPVLYKLLNDKHEIELLQNIPIINEVSNSFRKYYSYNIERKDAKEKSVGSEKENLINNLFNSDSKKFEDLMKKYQNSWNNIKDIAFKYGCRDEMVVHEIKNYESEKIAFFLVDKGELNYGMYLAAAYESLIRIQTNFINGILNFFNDNENDSIHKNYIKQLNKEINIQDAEKKDIPKMCNEEKLNRIINSCSIRKCFSKDGIIIYNNYEGIEINLDKIEEILCELILPQVKKFKTDISFVTYRFEGYRGENTVIFTNYIEKYNPQRKLNSDELYAIFSYIENNKDIKLNEFLFDLQKMINYIQEENYKNEYSISDIVNQMPSIIHLDKIKQFLNMNNKIGKDNNDLFTVNSLIDFYNLFEHLCWEEIKVNINNEYKKKFEKDEEKQKIIKYFNNLNKNCIINKLNLSTAIRRFISKYLSGLTDDSEKNENNKLMPELTREDLWDYSFVSHPYFEGEMDKIDKQFNITIGYAMDLYELLGGDNILLTNIKNSIKIEKKDVIVRAKKVKDTNENKKKNSGGGSTNQKSKVKKKREKQD